MKMGISEAGMTEYGELAPPRAVIVVDGHDRHFLTSLMGHACLSK